MVALRYLFVDMNSYFASVEQQDDPSLRQRPVGVVPVDTDATCCIAASYEAKAYGVKTGTGAGEAKRLCPQIRLVLARPAVYVAYHHRIIEAVESCLHVDKVCSIDEMYGRLMGDERQPAAAIAMAEKVKHAIATQVGPWVRCSIGLAPTPWLAKVATDIQKPDGLTVITFPEIRQKLAVLELRDLPGIGRKMEARLKAAGILTVEQLYDASQSELTQIWRSRVMGMTWWNQLHGHDMPAIPTQRRTVGHSHVLPPERRHEAGAKAVACRMLHKAATRMRKLGYHTRKMALSLRYVNGQRWHAEGRTGLCRDSLTLAKTLEKLWHGRPPGLVLGVGVTLIDLVADTCATRPLYPQEAGLATLADKMDAIDRKHGQHTIYFGGMWGAQESAPTRIAFTQIPQMDEFEQAVSETLGLPSGDEDT